MEEISFVAQVKEVKSKALVSLDKSARILLETENLDILDIGKWGGDELVKVSIQRMPKG